MGNELQLDQIVFVSLNDLHDYWWLRFAPIRWQLCWMLEEDLLWIYMWWVDVVGYRVVLPLLLGVHTQLVPQLHNTCIFIAHTHHPWVTKFVWVPPKSKGNCQGKLNRHCHSKKLKKIKFPLFQMLFLTLQLCNHIWIKNE